MAATDLERIFAALDDAHVRYLVVGGVAVVLHGHLRFTADVDLVLELNEENLVKGITALQSLGYRPRAPVDAMQFADASVRRDWVDSKGLTVFSLWSDALPGTEVDLFATEPFDFDVEYAQSIEADLGDVRIRVVSRECLIRMKHAAGRPKDIEDATVLESMSDNE